MTRKDWIKALLSIAGLALLVGWCVWMFDNKRKENELLDKYGKQTIATTIEARWRKRGKVVNYYYYANIQKYESWTKIPVERGKELRIVVPNGKYFLTYYPDDPKIHRIDLREPITTEVSPQ